VAKLFNVFTPDKAFFGHKDAQQVGVVKRMVENLNFPVEIVVCETVRDADGLALSSRNAYLDPEERRAAPVLCRALSAARVGAGALLSLAVRFGRTRLIDNVLLSDGRSL